MSPYWILNTDDRRRPSWTINLFENLLVRKCSLYLALPFYIHIWKRLRRGDTHSLWVNDISWFTFHDDSLLYKARSCPCKCHTDEYLLHISFSITCSTSPWGCPPFLRIYCWTPCHVSPNTFSYKVFSTEKASLTSITSLENHNIHLR